MFANFTLGRKIGFSFAVVIILSLVVGIITLIQMNVVKKDSIALTQEYIPEVEFAAHLRGAANRTMYEMRGFAYTGREEFIASAQKEM